MVSRSQRTASARKVTYVAAMAAVLVAGKEAVAALPSIEIVSLMVALFSVTFGNLTLYAIYVYVLAEGLLYGFYPWWFVPYLYVWTLLWAVCRLMRKNEDVMMWAVVLAIYGLLFGTLFSPMYFITGGWATGIAYIVAGLSFDLIHAAANFVLALLLWKPLSRALSKIAQQ